MFCLFMFFCISFRLDHVDSPRTRRYFEGEFEDKESAISALAEHCLDLLPHDDLFAKPSITILSYSEYLSYFK